MKLIYLFTIVCGLLFGVDNIAQDKKIEVGIDEKLGTYVPLDTKFVTSANDTLLLKDLVTKPTLLALIYYECPGICSPLLTELAWTVDKIELEPEADFQVVSLSFDHDETPAIAARWKKNYFEGMKGGFPEDAWTFLTGDSTNIKKLTDAIGFYFKPNDKEYIHPGAVITITPEGKISRYIYGLTYNPFDFKMALIDAEAGKTSPTIAKLLEFCYSYDPDGRTYTLSITRIVGALMLLVVGIFFIVLVYKKKKK